jgi:quinol monooxygenase YgiN
MLTVSLFVRLEAKPGKEAELTALLMQGLELARQEATTPVWFALRIGPSTFGIFDAFADEAGRRAHLNGPIAQALMAQAKPARVAARHRAGRGARRETAAVGLTRRGRRLLIANSASRGSQLSQDLGER